MNIFPLSSILKGTTILPTFYVMKQKKRIFRIKKVAPKRYSVEVRRKFMFFWSFWMKGDVRYGLSKFYANFQVAETAIKAKARKHGFEPIIIKYRS